MSVVLTPAALPANTLLGKVVNPLATSKEATFEESYQRKLGWTAGVCTRVRTAKTARLVMGMHDTGVSLWKVKKREKWNLDLPDSSEDKDGWEKLLEMELSLRTNLVAVAISDNGCWLAASDLYETKLFYINTTVWLFCFALIMLI